MHFPVLKGNAAKRVNFKRQMMPGICFFSDNNVQIILEHTNNKITDISAQYGNTVTFVNHVDETGLKAL